MARQSKQRIRSGKKEALRQGVEKVACGVVEREKQQYATSGQDLRGDF
jgi:hypothetical protein